MRTLEYIKQVEEIVVSKDSINSFAGVYVEDVLRKFFGKAFDSIKWCTALSWLINTYAHGAGCGMETRNACDGAYFDYKYYQNSNDDKLVLEVTMWKVVATEVQRKY